MTESDLKAQLMGLASQLGILTEKVDAAADQREAQDERLAGIEDRLAAVERATATELWRWVANHWRAALALTPLITAVLAIFLSGVWYLYGDRAVSFLQAELREAARANQILFQPEGLSFVRSPVEAGGVAEYILVARRTPIGASCTYRDTVPIFTDEVGRNMAGEFQSRGRQYGEEMTRTELGLPVPNGLAPGRVIVVLQVIYDCDGITIMHETYPVAFELRPPQTMP